MGERRRPAETFRDLIVWQKAHEYVRAVYEYTTSFPKHETFGLSDEQPFRLLPTLQRDSANADGRTRRDS
jgi:hypothetical protein